FEFRRQRFGHAVFEAGAGEESGAVLAQRLRVQGAPEGGVSALGVFGVHPRRAALDVEQISVGGVAEASRPADEPLRIVSRTLGAPGNRGNEGVAGYGRGRIRALDA